MLVDMSRNESAVLDEIRNSAQYSKADFGNESLRLRSEYSELILAAKVYILDNFSKIKDWPGLRFRVYSRNHDKPAYFGKREKLTKVENSVIGSIFEDYEKQYTAIETISEPVFDWTDGDFSITINGETYIAIDDASVIEMSIFMKRKLG